VSPLGNCDAKSCPYWDKMTELFAKGELKPLPFTKEDVDRYKDQVITLPLPRN